MAIHTIYVNINSSPARVREELIRSFTTLAWEHLAKSDNYYWLRILSTGIFTKD